MVPWGRRHESDLARREPWRGAAYAGAGPLLQFANYDQEFGGTSDNGSGFGFGGYARTGLELVLGSGAMVGIGARWSNSTVDLDGGLGDLEIEGTQLMLTVSQGL